MPLYPGEWASQGAGVQTPWDDICGLAEVGPLGPRCHRQRAPAVAQVRVRGGGSFPGFQRNRGGSQVWKLPLVGPIACSCLSDLPPSSLLCLGGVRFPRRRCQEAWGLSLLTSCLLLLR